MRRFKKILYVHDATSEVAAETLRLAMDLADRNDGHVDLIYVKGPSPAIVNTPKIASLHALWVKEAEEILTGLKKVARPESKSISKVVIGRPYIEVVREVIRRDYDLVIKPIGPYRLMDRLLGRLDMQLLRHCPCPVWLSKGEAYGAFDTVLAAVDGGEPGNQKTEDALNQQILELSFSLCEESKAELHVVHAWNAPYLTVYSKTRAGIPKQDIENYVRDEKRVHRNWLNRLMRRAAKWVNADVFGSVKRHTHLRQGFASEEVTALIAELESDLIVLGTVARTGLSGLIMGNTAEEILDQATCSILAVKPPGFDCQVRNED